jgi:hypothetical protein
MSRTQHSCFNSGLASGFKSQKLNELNPWNVECIHELV